MQRTLISYYRENTILFASLLNYIVMQLLKVYSQTLIRLVNSKDIFALTSAAVLHKTYKTAGPKVKRQSELNRRYFASTVRFFFFTIFVIILTQFLKSSIQTSFASYEFNRSRLLKYYTIFYEQMFKVMTDINLLAILGNNQVCGKL